MKYIHPTYTPSLKSFELIKYKIDTANMLKNTPLKKPHMYSESFANDFLYFCSLEYEEYSLLPEI